jgi:hypothetical protein
MAERTRRIEFQRREQFSLYQVMEKYVNLVVI